MLRLPLMRGLLGCLALALCTACGGEQPAPSATSAPATLAPTQTAAATDTPAADPAAMAICAELRASLEQTLKVETRPSPTQFNDPIAGTSAPGCVVEASGNGREFVDVGTVAEGLRSMFGGLGWSEDQGYAADGPTATGSAYRKDGSICMTLVEWRPDESVRCPQDQPISACNIAPEQQLYTIQVTCAAA